MVRLFFVATRLRFADLPLSPLQAGVIKELDYIGSVLQDAYGVVGGGVAEFEDLFANPAEDSSSDEEDDTLG